MSIIFVESFYPGFYPHLTYYATVFFVAIIVGPVLFGFSIFLIQKWCLKVCTKCTGCKSFLFFPPINLKKKQWKKYESYIHPTIFCPECSNVIHKTNILSETNNIHEFYELIKKKEHFPYVAFIAYLSNFGGFGRYSNFKRDLEFILKFVQEYDQERLALIVAFLDWYKNTGFNIAMFFDRTAADYKREQYLKAQRLNWAVKLFLFLIDEKPIHISNQLKKFNRSLFVELLPLLVDDRIMYNENRWPIAEIIYAINGTKAKKHLYKFVENEDTDDFKHDVSDQFADYCRYEICYPSEWIQFKNSVKELAKK